MVILVVDLRHWSTMLNGGALMNLLTLGNRGRICVSPKCFIANHELAVGRRRRRQDVVANEVAQMVISTVVGPENLLRSSDTWAGKLLKSQKIFAR